MGIRDLFRRFSDNEEVVDLSDLHKKGIYKPREDVDEEKKIINLTSPKGPGVIEPMGPGLSALGFLGSLAGASNSNVEVEKESKPEYYAEESTNDVSSNTKQRLKEIIAELRNKIDDSNRKMYKLTQRIEVLEKKISRLERNPGV